MYNIFRGGVVSAQWSTYQPEASPTETETGNTVALGGKPPEELSCRNTTHVSKDEHEDRASLHSCTPDPNVVRFW